MIASLVSSSCLLPERAILSIESDSVGGLGRALIHPFIGARLLGTR